MKKILSLLLVMMITLGLVACGGNDDPPEDLVDCFLNPEGEGCPVVEPGDTRTTEEIIADGVIDAWDGELTHLNTMLGNMNFDSAMEFRTEFNLEIVDDLDENHFVNAIVTDKFQ